MSQKTALVTGGSSGIGQGIAIVLAEHGYDVAITYGSNPDGAEATLQEIRQRGQKGYAIEAHMEQPDAAPKAVKRAIQDLGHLDALINNAGRTVHHSVMSITNEEMDYLVNLNFKAYILGAGAAARHMVRQGIKGNILFITSTRGSRAYAEDLLYGGLKAGINRACESMALDLAPYGIRVNCIAPGATEVRNPDNITGNPFADAIPLGRKGTPRENGELAAFLISDKCTYITGQTIRVDGGLTLPGMMEGSQTPGLVHSQTNPGWWERRNKMIETNFGEEE